MSFNWIKAIFTFIFGFIISFTMGALFNDGNMASMTAICYVGAIIVGLFSKNNID